MSKRAVFLDRDGVINDVVFRNGKPFVPTSVAEFRIYPGVREAIGALKERGFLCIVATNQPDVAKGDLAPEALEEIHRHLRHQLPELDDLRVCQHTDAHDCRCRKPRPGMLEDAARQWGIDLAASYMIGDRWRDIDAGQAVGCTTILVRHPHSDAKDPHFVVGSLGEAVGLILARETANTPVV